MNDENHAAFGWRWVAVIACVLLLAFAALAMMRSRSPQSSLINLDSNGITRLGPIPFRNTNVRNAAFSAIGHLNSGTVSVSATDSAKFGDLVTTVTAMRQAGITSVTVRVTGTNK